MAHRDGSSSAARRSAWIGLLAALLACLAAAAPAAASTWSATTLSDDQVRGPLFGVSCPSDGLCVAGGSDSLIATSTDPTGGRSAWRVFHPSGREDISAPPPGLGGGPVVFPGAQIRGVSCPTTSLCVAVTLDGRIFSSRNPTGGAAAWKVTPLSGPKEPNTHMTGVSCPAPSLCVAVAYGSKVLHSTDPAGDASAWTLTQLGGPKLDLRGVSCPTVGFCAAVDNEGSIVVSGDPAGPAAAWSPVGRPGGASGLNGISCPTPSLCVTGNAGQMIASTDPAGGVGAWRAVPAGTGLPVKGVSCPTTGACAAVDNNSDAIVSTNPTGGAGAWSFTNVIPAPQIGGGPNGTFGISCPSVSLCVAVGAQEQIISSADPFAPDPVVSAGPRGGLRVLITSHPPKRVPPRRRGARVAFRFHAIGGRAARFKCKLSGRRRGHRHRHRRGFSACRSPVRYRVGGGKHVFRVRAIAPGGRRSRPATFHFRVGHLIERQPVGSCRPLPPGLGMHPCIESRPTGRDGA